MYWYSRFVCNDDWCVNSMFGRRIWMSKKFPQATWFSAIKSNAASLLFFARRYQAKNASPSHHFNLSIPPFCLIHHYLIFPLLIIYIWFLELKQAESALYILKKLLPTTHLQSYVATQALLHFIPTANSNHNSLL